MPSHNQTRTTMERKFLFFLGILLTSTPTLAGSGLYFGTDAVLSNLKTTSTTVVDQTSPVSQTTSYGNTLNRYTDLGGRIGYKFKSRLTDHYYWAPEFSLLTFDKSIIYATNLKFGYEFAPYEFYTSFGVSRINKFTDNRLNLTLGLEYRLSNTTSLNIALTSYDNIKESTNSTSTVGLNTITINTNTIRTINSIKIGYTYYFKGSK